MRHIRKGDEVMVLGGKEKGKKGKVLKVYPDPKRAVVEKLNFVKRHMKPNPQAPQGGLIEKEASLPLGQLKLVCPRCGKPSRTSRKILDDSKRARVCVRCGEVVDKS